MCEFVCLCACGSTIDRDVRFPAPQLLPGFNRVEEKKAETKIVWRAKNTPPSQTAQRGLSSNAFGNH